MAVTPLNVAQDDLDTVAAIVRAAETLVEKGKKAAADVLETAEADILYKNGTFTVAGTDRRISLFELADRAKCVQQGAAQRPQHAAPANCLEILPNA